MARRLHRALTMPLKERRRRHEALLEHVTRNDARTWLDGFLAALKPPAEAPPARPALTDHAPIG
jgi:trehalose 6-phosphate synthase